MTDQTDRTDQTDQIGAAYARLTTALTTPADADRLVAARVAVRRRRRRATQGLAAVGVGAVAVATLALGGADRPGATPQPAPAASPTATPTTTPTSPAQPDDAADRQACMLLRLRELAGRPAQPGAGPEVTLAELRRLARDPERTREARAACRPAG